jgi:hypothetical protein
MEEMLSKMKLDVKGGIEASLSRKDGLPLKSVQTVDFSMTMPEEAGGMTVTADIRETLERAPAEAAVTPPVTPPAPPK